MADPIAQSRTNYFRVKDVDAFIADAARYGITFDDWATYGAEIVLDRGENNQPAGSIALFAYGFWPNFDEDTVADRLEIEDETVEVPQDYEGIEDLIAAHLVDTDVAVVTGVSFEKMRYLSGYAVAVNARGERRSLNLNDIYERADEIATDGTPVTIAEY